MEPVHAIGIVGELFWQDLDGNFTLQLQVAGTVHLTHATLAEQRGELVGAELSANGQSHNFAGDYRTTCISGRVTL